uniref:Melanoma receptor tyrosine kinase n=1 Tax=Hydatigena taeniaeformis TaxID=6205 RepID=A0A0R3WYZ7_HYDTA
LDIRYLWMEVEDLLQWSGDLVVLVLILIILLLLLLYHFTYTRE